MKCKMSLHTKLVVLEYLVDSANSRLIFNYFFSRLLADYFKKTFKSRTYNGVVTEWE